MPPDNRPASNSDAMSAAHHPLSTPNAFDRAKSAGFTAVNGEPNVSTSFRPLDGSTVERDDSPARERSHQPRMNGESDHSHREADGSVYRDSSVQDTLPVIASPPVKRQRLSEAGTERSARFSPNGERDSVSSNTAASTTSPEMTIVDDDGNTSLRTASEPASAHRSEPQAWNPQDIRPETSRNLQEALQSHLNATRAREEADNSFNGVRPQTNGDTTNASAEPPSTDGSGKRKREFAHRTKTGCHTCRQRKKKCDENKPECTNCIRGKFLCGGYGPANKNINYKRQVPTKVQQIIQAKPMDFSAPHGRAPSEPQWHGAPPGYLYEPSRQAPPPAHMPPIPVHAYGPPNHDTRDGWNRQPYADAPYLHLQHNKLPHVDFAPIQMYPQGEPHSRPPASDAYASLPYRSSTSGPPPFPPHDSIGSSAPRRSSHLPPMQIERELTERDKMLEGLPYRHSKDRGLIADRLDCKAAVDLYNRAALPSEALSLDERANRFSAVLDPNKRNSRQVDTGALGRIGSCGERTLVEPPFYCDYGYNLNIGAETLIYPGCFIQDPCEISIGNRCTIGPNVNFFGMTFSIDTKSIAGSQGTFLGGSIRVEDDCKIGGNVTILAYRVIGKGAIVAAGSVVTRNVKPYTIVAGNPAKEVRTINESTVDRRMRTEIQEENDRMIEEMRMKRQPRHHVPEPPRRL